MMNNDVCNMTDKQWCYYLKDRFGTILALDIFAQFSETDGTAPLDFQTYANMQRMRGASHGRDAGRLAA